MIRYQEAKEILAKYKGVGGACVDAPGLDSFVLEVLQYLLFYGTSGNERTFTFNSQNGIITLPYELESPTKIRVCGEVSNVWNQWFEYKSGIDLNGCTDAPKGLLTQPNRYPTIYDLPSGGGHVAATAKCKELEGAHLVVKGLDMNGQEVFTSHKGTKVAGEYLSLCKGAPHHSITRFSKITAVVKELTNGYVALTYTDSDGCYRGFLSEYGPLDLNPRYQRARLLIPCATCCEVDIIGRIRLKDAYAPDDLIPFENRYLLSVAGQTVNSMRNDDVQVAMQRDQYAEKLIEKEGVYKKVNNGQPVEMFRPLSGGSIHGAAKAGRALWRKRRPYG